MKNRASGGFTFMYVFIKSKNTSEQMKLFIFIIINIISTIFLIEVCTRHMDQIKDITRNCDIE